MCALTLFILFALAVLVDFNGQLPTTNSFIPFISLEESPYYTNDESRQYTWRTPAFFPPLKPSHAKKPVDLCAGFPTHLLKDIQIVLRTGAGESARTRAHVATVTSCISDLLIFSDLEGEVGGHEVIDVLADLPSSYNDNSDFAAYASQKKAYLEGRPIEYSSEGWKLDRFKFLPMVDKAYQLRPRKSWYVFVEGDVYYFWDTLFRLLHQLDPSKMHYLGSPAPGRDGTYFAYGGAGFVLSRGLIQRLTGDSTQLSVSYEEDIKNDCCGDAVLAYAIMNKTREPLQALYPTFAGDDLVSLEVNEERWCTPLLALHRVSPDQMASLWKWERTRPYNEVRKSHQRSCFLTYARRQDPLTYSTVLDYLLSGIHESSTRIAWDNHATDAQPDGSATHSSAVECASGCASEPSCMQYLYSAGTCKFGKSVKMGRPMPHLGADSISGWDMEKITALGFETDANKSSSCKQAAWLKPVIRQPTNEQT